MLSGVEVRGGWLVSALVTISFGSFGTCQVVLEKEISIPIKHVNARELKVF